MSELIAEMSEVMPSSAEVLSSSVELFNAWRDRALRRQLAEKNIELQKELKSQECRLNEKLDALHRKQELAIASADRELQVKLAHENRELQWQMAVFSECSRRQNALREIEKRFYVDNFPLYIRKENYCDFVEANQVPAVKIVFSPPVIDRDNGAAHALAGIDVLMTARMSRFLHNTFDHIGGNNQLYEYVGNAWRDKQFRGQSAYRYIFNEFSSEPFVIVDCEVVRKRLTFQLCYWIPGDSAYHTFQVTDGLGIEQILYESMRCRTEAWENARFVQMKDAGFSDEEIEALYPEEYQNMMFLQKERRLPFCDSETGLFDYQYSERDYDALIEVIALLSQISVGVFVDIYQMSAGNLKSPCFLEFLVSAVSELPETGDLRKHVEELAVRQYLDFTDPEKEQQALKFRSQDYQWIRYYQDSTSMVNCRLLLADILYAAQDEGEAQKYFVSAWLKWCDLLGISAGELTKVCQKQNIKEVFLEEMRSDSAMEGALQRLHQHSGRPYAEEYRQVINTLAAWCEEDWKNQPGLYR